MGLVCVALALLPVAVVARWGSTGWLPVSTQHEALELGPMYIGGIAVEVLHEHGYCYQVDDHQLDACPHPSLTWVGW